MFYEISYRSYLLLQRQCSVTGRRCHIKRQPATGSGNPGNTHTLRLGPTNRAGYRSSSADNATDVGFLSSAKTIGNLINQSVKGVTDLLDATLKDDLFLSSQRRDSADKS